MKDKMLQLRCDAEYHDMVMRYAAANNRSVTHLMRHALRFYMAAHPFGSVEAIEEQDEEKEEE